MSQIDEAIEDDTEGALEPCDVCGSVDCPCEDCHGSGERDECGACAWCLGVDDVPMSGGRRYGCGGRCRCDAGHALRRGRRG